MVEGDCKSPSSWPGTNGDLKGCFIGMLCGYVCMYVAVCMCVSSFHGIQTNRQTVVCPSLLLHYATLICAAIDD